MGDYWQPTAEMFSSLFTNPKMTKKHLMRPPFKYILHIIIKTMKVQGFAQGLYTEEELDFAYYQKNKMQKLVFLQKMIDLTEMMTGESYNISPKSIAAGKECEKTNKFLQGIYKAAIHGDNSEGT